MQSGIQDPADFQHCRQHCSSQYNACTLWTVSVMKITYYQFNVAHKKQPETAVSESRWDVKFTQIATCPTKDLIANKLKNLQPYHVMFITRDRKILSLKVCQMQVCEMTLLKKHFKSKIATNALGQEQLCQFQLNQLKKHKWAQFFWLSITQLYHTITFTANACVQPPPLPTDIISARHSE